MSEQQDPGGVRPQSAEGSDLRPPGGREGGGADAGHGVGLVAPRNVQRRAMTRLEQALTTLGLRIAQQDVS